jgi:RimJ/RimL family protein N-acetyltransferase
LQIGEFIDSNQAPDFLVSVIEILTPSVVENLPPYFQNVNSISSAQEWLKQIVADGRLFIVKRKGENKAVGFVFLSTENSGDAHIGYLLGESFWGKGYATEILKGLIDFIESEGQVTRLIAGVAADNLASIKLLQKLGFIHSSSEDNGTMFYEYRLCKKEYEGG